MPKPKHQQMDFRGLEIVADEFTGVVSGALSGVAVIATADATDPATTQALVNICKAKINEIINALN